jgi:hypothetical protein
MTLLKKESSFQFLSLQGLRNLMKLIAFCATSVEGGIQNNIILVDLLLSACFKTNFKTLPYDYRTGMFKSHGQSVGKAILWSKIKSVPSTAKRFC